MKLLDTAVSEKEFQANVIELAGLLGWRHYHVLYSQKSPPGFPDLVLVRDGRLIFAELKSERGRLTHPQRVWLAALKACPGVQVYEWRPSDWPEIEGVLR